MHISWILYMSVLWTLRETPKHAIGNFKRGNPKCPGYVTPLVTKLLFVPSGLRPFLWCPRVGTNLVRTAFFGRWTDVHGH